VLLECCIRAFGCSRKIQLAPKENISAVGGEINLFLIILIIVSVLGHPKGGTSNFLAKMPK
jgi:hypothetical protein